MTAGRAQTAPGCPTRRAVLLLGTSLAGSVPGAALAAGPAPFSSGWFAVKGANGPAASAAIANAVAGAGINSKSYAQVQQSLANLRQSAAAIAAMQTLQSQARAVSGASGVPDGLQAGGIVPDSGLAGTGTANPVTSWTGAQTPVQSGPAGRPTVTVRQTAQSALLNWRTLNVGRNTRLSFDQSAGGAAAPTWVALNRVSDPNASPTQILGQVSAQGHVIVVNGSGIIFAPTAQVTVGSLIASTAAISDAPFKASGIYSADSVTPSFTGAIAPVLVEAGAQITTDQPVSATSAGGGVILLGSSVSNAGDIQTPDGQTILAAGKDFILQQGYGVTASGQNVSGVSNALVGGLASTAGFGPGGTVVETVEGSAIAVADGGGAATNEGLIEASTGDVTMVGETLTQAGAIVATTSVSTRGTIHLLTDQTDGKASVTLAPGSVTTILPDANSNTALDAQRTTGDTDSADADALRNAGGALPLNDQPNLPDDQIESLIQIVSGNSVDVRGGALALSEGGQIQIAAPGRVLVEPGADLDVSGAVGVSLPMSANQVSVNVQGFELRDNPLNRDTTRLNNANVELDIRTLVTAPANGTDYQNSPYTTTARLYSPSGLFEVSGEVSNIAHSVAQWTTAGGTILVSGGSKGQFIAEQGSVLNLAGGSIDYQAGALGLSWLIGPDGRLYNAATAPSDLAYTGVYGGFTVDHPRWNISQTYNDPEITPTSIEMPAYVEGRDGGTLEVSEPTVALNGTVNAGVIDGPLQTQPHVTETLTDPDDTAQTYTDPYFEPANAVSLPGQVLIGHYGGLGYGAAGLVDGPGFVTAVTVDGGGASLPGGLGVATPLPAAALDTAVLDGPALDAAGLGVLSVETSGAIAVEAPLSVAPAGTIALHGATVAVDADLTARAGTVSLGDVVTGPTISTSFGGLSLVPTATLKGVTAQTGPASVTVAPGVTIDLTGTWTNLLSNPVAVAGEATSGGGTFTADTTGAVTLGRGSLLDVSSGAVVTAAGALSGGVGGSVTLIGDDPSGNPAYDTQSENQRYADPALVGASLLPVTLAGMIRDENLSGNGGSTGADTLTLRAPGVLIADRAPAGGLDASGRTVLTPSFFRAGFSSYVIDGYGNLALPAGKAGGSAPAGTTGGGAPAGATGGSAASTTAADLPGVEIAAGVAVQPVVPVYLETAASLLARTGSDPETSASLYLPPAYLQNQATATLAPRAGASLTLQSRTFTPSTTPAAGGLDGGGDIAIDPGASVRVDASQSVGLEAVGQITVDGSITAPGGTISITNDFFEPGPDSFLPALYRPGLSIWIGGDAVLSTRGAAQSAVDEFGRAYGLAPAGGSITIGGSATVANSAGVTFPVSTDATIIVRPGAVIDASGSAGSTDLNAGADLGAAPDIVPVAGSGGSISLNSTSGIVLDGTLRADAGGPTAAGGSLEIDLVTPSYSEPEGLALTGVPDDLRVQREVVIGQSQPASVLPADLEPGQSVLSALGTVRLGADGVMAGGFANLTIAGNAFASFGPTDVRFDGSVNLSLPGSIDLPGAMTDTRTDAAVTLKAPYVTLNGNAVADFFSSVQTQNIGAVATDTAFAATAAVAIGVSTTPNKSSVSVQSGQLTIGTGELQGVTIDNALNAVDGKTPITVFSEPGFADASLSSTGDTQVAGTFVGAQSLTVTAAQIYPVVGSAELAVPLDEAMGTGGTQTGSGPGTLILARTPGTDPAPPLVVGDDLSLIGGRIEQGGLVRAALGVLNVGYYSGSVSNGGGTTLPLPALPPILAAGTTESIAFLPGSVTSVSMAGQTILYGGTQDGIIYDTGGNATTPSFQPAIVTASPSVSIEAGATLDLRGGGTLAGAGFNSGRGGSTDVLATPLLQFSGSTATPANDAVYSIVPGAGTTTQPAPVTGYGYTTNVAPATGEQVTIGAGVPGLPAGTYTLQPAYDALLPGAFRVEIETGVHPLAGAAAVGNLSTLTAGTLGVAGTSIAGTEPVGVLVTSGANVRRLSSYDEETPAAFVTAQAALLDVTRGYINADAGLLVLDYAVPPPAQPSLVPGLSVEGDVLFAPGAGGRGGEAQVVALDADGGGGNANIDIVSDAPGQGVELGGPQYPTDTVFLRASDLDRLGAEVLSIGGPTDVATASFSANTSQVEMENGAVLSAPQVFLLGSNSVALESGAVIDTLGAAIPDDQVTIATPYGNTGFAALVVSNAAPTFTPPTLGLTAGAASFSVASGASLFSQGTVAIDTAGPVTVGTGTMLAARRLYLAVSNANITPAGGVPAGAQAPAGIELSQTLLDGLTAGGLVPGAPALQQINIVASGAVNFFGTTGLALSGNGTLEFDTPSIYGYGASTDNATISARTVIWNGIAQAPAVEESGYVSALPAGVLSNGPGSGSGSLTVDADTIILGYAPGVVPSTPAAAPATGAPVLDRNTYGFGTVTLRASGSVIANNSGTLSVYQSQGAYTEGGFANSGGNLSIVTPELTAAPGALLQVTAGGTIDVSSPGGAAGAAGGLGGEIDLTGASIGISTDVAMPEGKLALTAAGNIAFGAGAAIDLAGIGSVFFDQTVAGPGGTLTAESTTGGITADPASTIDMSSPGAPGGTINVTATAGDVLLAGAISGGGSTGGTIDVRAGTLSDFGGLNQRLTAGGLTGSRSFEIGSGDLTIQSSDAVRASSVSISVDGGSLTVDGLIDASGAAPGRISLSAGQNLVLTGNAALDAHGTVPQTDSSGATIDSENSGSVTLRVADGPNGITLSSAGTTVAGDATGATGTGLASSPTGTLTIAPGATIDVSAPPGVTCALGACGSVEIDVPRLGSAYGTNGDLSVSVPGPVTIEGAGSVAVDGFFSYVPSDGTVVQTNISGGAPVDANGVGLDEIDVWNKAFIAGAVVNGSLNPTLAGKLAGLDTTAYAAILHLRPGVEIDSSTASGGDLTVSGDIDLSGLRYASLRGTSNQLTSTVGSGEPGVLVLRAANNLNVYGSITDGFAPPVDSASNPNPDDNGWQLYPSAIGDPLDQNVVVPAGASPIDIGGSTFAIQNVTLNYDLPVVGSDTTSQALLPGVTLPTSITLSDAVIVPQGGVVAQAAVIGTDGKTVLYTRGSLIPGGTVLQAGTSLSAGFLLFKPADASGYNFGDGAEIGFDTTNALTGQNQVWPAGANLDAFISSSYSVALGASVPLVPGDLIPGGGDSYGQAGQTMLVLNGSSFGSVPLRPTATLASGATGQGEVYAAANLLPPGSLSWSISLVGGGAAAAADPASLTPTTVLAADGETGNLTLSDLHYEQLTAGGTVTPLSSFSVVRTGTGSLSLLAGGTLDEASTYGIYTAGTQSPGVIGTAFDQKSALYPGGDATVSNMAAASVYQAIDAAYPQGGGNVTVDAQGALLTTSLPVVDFNNNASFYSSVVGQWLQLQGNGSASDPGAWSINFGNYTPVVGNGDSGAPATLPILTGFTGIGTLGGGNLTVSAASAGVDQIVSSADESYFAPIEDNSFSDSASFLHSTALDLAVGSSGRETASGLTLTGGGLLSLNIATSLDPVGVVYNQPPLTVQSTIVDLRGGVTVNAGTVSFVNGSTGLGSPTTNPYGATLKDGPDIILGDATAQVYTRGDLSLGTTGDPGLEPSLAVGANGATSWFTLWEPSTAVALFSAGGDVSPAYVTTGATITTPTLDVVAASGSIFVLNEDNQSNPYLETAPSASGELEFLAGDSIVNAAGATVGPVITMSGADPSLLPTVAEPAFSGATGGTASNTTEAADTLFAFSTDTATGYLHAGDPQPMRFYAENGDIEFLSTGIDRGTQYQAAKAVQIRAGDDIVDLDRVAQSGLFFDNNPTDISVVSAGNNIYYANATVSGPGLLEVSAGGNIDQTDTGTPGSPDPSTLVSVGYLVDKTVATQNAGAGITVTAGVTAGSINLAGFAQLYFDAAHLADPVTPLQDQPGKVERTYQDQLLGFLQGRGYTGPASGALAAFLALPADVQQILVLQVYYAELNQSGLDYADPTSRFYQSYGEGTEAIRTLFPATDLTGGTPASGGGLTLTGNSGITTEFGGAIEVADPFGATTVGVPGPVPGATSGIITQGQGDVDVYSYGSVLLGQSRIFTTFGGNLLIWLEGNGEINGGQGSKSTIIFTPPNITYDPYADISLSPTVPATGAGLATLAPVASVPAGNINLISPFGTIDAGEAGIRSSGNINLVALTVVNAANVQAGGKVTGVTVTAAPNTAGITAASAAAGAVQNAARNTVGTPAAQQTPSIITVDVVGQGQSGSGGTGGTSSEDDRRRHKGKT